MYHGGDRTRYYRQGDRAEHRTHKHWRHASHSQPEPGGRGDRPAAASKEPRSADDEAAELAAQISAQIQKDGIFDVAVQAIVDTALQQKACTALSEKLKKDLGHSIWHQLDSGMVLPRRKSQIRVASLKRVLHDPSAERFNTSTLYQIVSDNCDWDAVMQQAGVTGRVQQLVQQLVPEPDQCAGDDSGAKAPKVLVIDVSSDGPSVDAVATDGVQVLDAVLTPHEAVVEAECGEQAMDLDSATPPDVTPHIEQAPEDLASTPCPNVGAFATATETECALRADDDKVSVCPAPAAADDDSRNVTIESAATLVVCQEPASPDSDQSDSSNYGSSPEGERLASAWSPLAKDCVLPCAEAQSPHADAPDQCDAKLAQAETRCQKDVTCTDHGAVPPDDVTLVTPEADTTDLPSACGKATALDECKSELVAHIGGNDAQMQVTGTETVVAKCEPLEQGEQTGCAATSECTVAGEHAKADGERAQQAATATGGELQLEPVSDDEPYPIATVDSPRQLRVAEDGGRSGAPSAGCASGRRAGDTVDGRRSSSARRKRTRSPSRSRNRRTPHSSHSRSDRPRRDQRKSRTHGDYSYY